MSETYKQLFEIGILWFLFMTGLWFVISLLMYMHGENGFQVINRFIGGTFAIAAIITVILIPYG